MKNKFVIIAVIVLLILGGGGYFFIASQKSSGKPATDQAIQEEVIPTISASDLGLTTTLRDDNKAVKFEIANASDIESVDYQISYTKEVNGEQVPEGLIGTAKPTDGKISIKYREFGTCSSGKCRYDNVVSAVKLILKVTKTDGKAFQAETTVEIPGVSDSNSPTKAPGGLQGGDY